MAKPLGDTGYPEHAESRQNSTKQRIGSQLQNSAHRELLAVLYCRDASMDKLYPSEPQDTYAKYEAVPGAVGPKEALSVPTYNFPA
jgi:hypothetical protein